MHMSGMPLAALLAIIAFGLLCVIIGVACLIAAVHQRAAEAPGLLAMPAKAQKIATHEVPAHQVQTRESLTDGMGVVAYRLFNRVLISTLGGGILIALFGKAKSRA